MMVLAITYDFIRRLGVWDALGTVHGKIVAAYSWSTTKIQDAGDWGVWLIGVVESSYSFVNDFGDPLTLFLYFLGTLVILWAFTSSEAEAESPAPS